VLPCILITPRAYELDRTENGLLGLISKGRTNCTFTVVSTVHCSWFPKTVTFLSLGGSMVLAIGNSPFTLNYEDYMTPFGLSNLQNDGAAPFTIFNWQHRLMYSIMSASPQTVDSYLISNLTIPLVVLSSDQNRVIHSVTKVGNGEIFIADSAYFSSSTLTPTNLKIMKNTIAWAAARNGVCFPSRNNQPLN